MLVLALAIGRIRNVRFDRTACDVLKQLENISILECTPMLVFNHVSPIIMLYDPHLCQIPEPFYEVLELQQVSLGFKIYFDTNIFTTVGQERP